MEKEVYTEYRAEKLLKKFVPVVKNQLVNDIKEIKFKKFPLVLKIISLGALHKSDIGGVKVVGNKEELERGFKSLINLAKKKRLKLEGILVQEFVKGYELIVGIKKDSVFGHVLLFGAGGIYTEILKDISIRACPITLKDADSMIQDLKTKDILYGARGEKANVGKLKKNLVKISKIPLRYKKIEELDINPLIVNKKDVLVADARIVFEK
ncbi:MAG: acetate--CoA ligase family protein [Candidatus Woesearchaeota archaeon]